MQGRELGRVPRVCLPASKPVSSTPHPVTLRHLDSVSPSGNGYNIHIDISWGLEDAKVMQVNFGLVLKHL